MERDDIKRGKTPEGGMTDRGLLWGSPQKVIRGGADILSMMLEILIAGLLVWMLVARKGKRRKMGRYIRGSVNEGFSLGTLAGGTLLSTVFDETVSERTLISSLIATYALADVTVGTDIGPVMVGVAHSDYTDAEIEAVIEATSSWAEADLVAREVANRKVRRIGIFHGANTNAAGIVTLNDGKPIKTKLNWILTTGQTLNLWCYNMGANAFATTAPVCRIEGHANLWPR